MNAGAESVRSGSKGELRRGSILEIKRIGGDANSLFVWIIKMQPIEEAVGFLFKNEEF